MQKKPFEEILSEVNRKFGSPVEPEELVESFPLSDVMDKEILMHREAHFGGKFDIMLEYYYSGGKGTHPEFQLRRMEELKALEDSMEENLAGLLLSGAEAEEVARARDVYKKLRDLYGENSSEARIPRLIADLILSEEPEAEMETEAIIAEGKKIIPFLLDLLRSEDFHNPLFPGYGQAPFLAAKCLGLIGEEKAIISLFENIGRGDFENEKMVIKALKNVGDPAKDFLLKVVSSKPFSEDNERAALALIQFQDDPRVAESCLGLLENPEIFAHDSLATYLILACEGLKDPGKRERFAAIAKKSDLPSHFKQDIQAVINSWDTA
jgi:hypothetical protein